MKIFAVAALIVILLIVFSISSHFRKSKKRGE